MCRPAGRAAGPAYIISNDVTNATIPALGSGARRSDTQGMTTFVGVDLAWAMRNRTGLAAVDGSGRLLDVATARTDEEILGWLAPYLDGPCVVSLDAPIVVRNASGRRRCEAELNEVFARHEAGAHPSNTSRPWFAGGTRAERLARAMGLDLDPHARPERQALEVYPHPATIALFGLETTVKYKHKHGRDLPLLRSELLRLVGLIEGLAYADPALHVAEHPRWREIRQRVAASRRKVDLKIVEDRVDAVLCAYVGLLSRERPGDVRVFGDAEHGSIVTPDPGICVHR